MRRILLPAAFLLLLVAGCATAMTTASTVDTPTPPPAAPGVPDLSAEGY